MPRFFLRLGIAVILFSLTATVHGQHLKRRAALGARLSAVEGKPGLRIDDVAPGLTGANTGLQKGDILLTVNGEPIPGVAGVGAFIRKFLEGDKAVFEVQRGEKKQTLSGTFTGRNKETAPGLELIYTETQVGNEYHRTVIQKPANATGKLPAVLFIQGIYCSSVIDLPPGHPYYDLLTPIAQKGFVILRTERSGLSDSEGKPCGEVSFLEELEGYKAALKQLRELPYVDTSRIYVLGHSLGGIMAPLVAADQDIKGVITYGTAAKLWSLYEIENVLDQSLLAEKPDYAQAEAAVKQHQQFVHLFFGQKMTPEQISKANPEMKEYFGPDGTYASRHYSFFHQLNDVNFAEAWKKVKGKVLVLYGETDFQTNAENNRYIADMVNSFRPGAAEFKILPQVDHTFQASKTKRESAELTARGDYTRFNKIVVDEILAGLNRMQ
jgi:dienelactone hydrolase